MKPADTDSQRAQEMAYLRSEGYSYQAIGARFGLTHAGVRAVLRRSGLLRVVGKGFHASIVHQTPGTIVRDQDYLRALVLKGASMPKDPAVMREKGRKGGATMARRWAEAALSRPTRTPAPKGKGRPRSIPEGALCDVCAGSGVYARGRCKRCYEYRRRNGRDWQPAPAKEMRPKEPVPAPIERIREVIEAHVPEKKPPCLACGERTQWCRGVCKACYQRWLRAKTLET